MIILSVEPKEIHVTLDMTLSEVEMLLEFLSKSKVEYNSREEPEMVKISDFVKNTFFKLLDSIHEQFKGK